MKTLDILLLLALGAFIWILGTIYFANYRAAMLNSGGARYWVTFILSPILSTLLCIAILRWRRLAPAHWTAAMLLLAIPGMVGEALVLSNMAVFLPKLHANSGGRYAALLFVTYAVALTLAEAVTLRATL